MDAPSLIIGSFNLRTPGSNDAYPNDWRSRIPRIRATCARAGFHVWGAQETVDFYDGPICRDTAFKSIGCGRCEKADGEACHIYHDSVRLVPLRTETFWLTATPERYSIIPGATYPRIAVAAVFLDRETGTHFIFCTTHLEHRVKELQLGQMEYLFAHLERTFPDLPLILTGDFNAFPGAPAVEYTASKLRDARSVSEMPVSYDGPTWHGYEPDPAKRKNTAPIDYIFVSEEIRIKRFEVIDDFDADGRASSDHFPLRAEAVLP